MYSKNVLDVDCHTQGRLKFMIELYFRKKSVINSKYRNDRNRKKKTKNLFIDGHFEVISCSCQFDNF
jgi:hypothetical protein